MKKKNNSKLFFGLFIIILMVSSTIGFIYGGEETKKFNGYKFTKTEFGWRTYIESLSSYWDFYYLPTEIDFDVSVFDEDLVYLYGGDNLSLEKFKLLFLYKGVVAETLDEKNCELEGVVFVINPSFSDVGVVRSGNCIQLNGNINKFIDGLTYRIFGVL